MNCPESPVCTPADRKLTSRVNSLIIYAMFSSGYTAQPGINGRYTYTYQLVLMFEIREFCLSDCVGYRQCSSAPRSGMQIGVTWGNMVGRGNMLVMPWMRGQLQLASLCHLRYPSDCPCTTRSPGDEHIDRGRGLMG